MTAAFKHAFPRTIPVFFGYLFLGISFGILLIGAGLDWYWAPIMCLTIFAGSVQFVAVGSLMTVFNPLTAVILTLAISARQLFYGLSMLRRYADVGKIKPYLIFALTDETYSLLVAADIPENVDRGWFYFWVSALDQSYWVLGSTLGALFGAFLRFNSKGVEFAMTALFLYIFLTQWESQRDHAPHLIGIASALVCIWIFGPANFIIPAMILILAGLLAIRGRKADEGRAENAADADSGPGGAK